LHHRSLQASRLISHLASHHRLVAVLLMQYAEKLTIAMDKADVPVSKAATD